MKLECDFSQVFKQLRGKDGLSVHLVEISPEFSRIQAEKLCSKGSIEKVGFVPDAQIKEGGRRYSVGKDTGDTTLTR